MKFSVLRKHGSKVGLKMNWALCDTDQQLAYCKAILNQPAFAAKNANLPVKLKPNSVLNYVSKRKSKGDAFDLVKGDPFMVDLYQYVYILFFRVWKVVDLICVFSGLVGLIRML